ncbi:Hypothetical protein SMAX5B_016616, partial [Scophthalmus maximus]
PACPTLEQIWKMQRDVHWVMKTLNGESCVIFVDPLLFVTRLGLGDKQFESESSLLSRVRQLEVAAPPPPSTGLSDQFSTLPLAPQERRVSLRH